MNGPLLFLNGPNMSNFHTHHRVPGLNVQKFPCIVCPLAKRGKGSPPGDRITEESLRHESLGFELSRTQCKLGPKEQRDWRCVALLCFGLHIVAGGLKGLFFCHKISFDIFLKFKFYNFCLGVVRLDVA